MSSSLERENIELNWRLRQLERQISKSQREVSGQEAEERRQYAARFDAAAASLGETAPPPNQGESPLEYRRRLAGKLAAHSQQFKESRFDTCDAATLDAIEPKLHADARASAVRGAANAGRMIAAQEPDGSGRVLTKHYGSPRSWMQHFMSDGHCATIMRNPNGE